MYAAYYFCQTSTLASTFQFEFNYIHSITQTIDTDYTTFI